MRIIYIIFVITAILLSILSYNEGFSKGRERERDFYNNREQEIAYNNSYKKIAMFREEIEYWKSKYISSLEDKE